MERNGVERNAVESLKMFASEMPHESRVHDHDRATTTIFEDVSESDVQFLSFPPLE